MLEDKHLMTEKKWLLVLSQDLMKKIKKIQKLNLKMQNGDVYQKNNQDNVKKKQFDHVYSKRNKRDKMILDAKIYLTNKGKNG